jgi:hypothetical protein
VGMECIDMMISDMVSIWRVTSRKATGGLEAELYLRGL